MEQSTKPSSIESTPVGTFYGSVMDSLMQGAGTISKWLSGASSSQGKSSGSGSDASEPSASVSAAKGSQGNGNIAREQEHPAELNATSATPPVILGLVEVYLEGQQSEVKPHCDQLNPVFVELLAYEKTYRSQGKPRPQNLHLNALARACIAVNIRLSPKAFEYVCEELLKHQKLTAKQVEQYLADLGKGSRSKGLARVNEQLKENLLAIHKPSE